MKLAIIHTTAATVEPLRALAAELVPGCGVVNFVDDSILQQLLENGGQVSAVAGRLQAYARFAEQVGADAVLEACSSVGEAVEDMRRVVSVPVLRIDEAMAEQAVNRAGCIGVAATMSTTLEPTKRLLEQKARRAGKRIEMRSKLVSEAFARLQAGDMAGHDALLTDALSALVREVEVVVLAQASMARVLGKIPARQRERFLTSPRSAMERARLALSRRPARVPMIAGC